MGSRINSPVEDDEENMNRRELIVEPIWLFIVALCHPAETKGATLFIC